MHEGERETGDSCVVGRGAVIIHPVSECGIRKIAGDSVRDADPVR